MPGEPGAGHAAAAGGEAAPGGREQGARGAPPEQGLRVVVVGARGVGKSALAVSLSAVPFVVYSVNITHTTCSIVATTLSLRGFNCVFFALKIL